MEEQAAHDASAGPPAPVAGEVVREQDKLMLVLAYLPPLSFVPFLTAKDSEFVRWHARQGIALTAFAVAWALLGGALSALVGLLSPRLGAAFMPLSCAGFALLLAVCAAGILKAFEARRWRIPLVSKVAERF